MRCRAIQEYDRRYPIGLMCRALAVSPAGYYARRDRPESCRSMQNRTLLSAIRVIHRESRETYGSPSSWDALSKQGHDVGQHRVARLMRQAGLHDRAEVARYDPVESPVARGREYPQSPVRRGAAQLGLGRGHHVCLDRRGLAVSGGDPRSLLARGDWLGDGPALDRGAGRARLAHGAHDSTTRRGAAAPLRSQQSIYCRNLPAGAHQARPHAQHEPQGNCWDNACVESFFGTLKRELVHYRHDATRNEAQQDIFEYREVFYNRKRHHSTLGYDSPAEFEARRAVAYPRVHGNGGRSTSPANDDTRPASRRDCG